MSEAQSIALKRYVDGAMKFVEQILCDNLRAYETALHTDIARDLGYTIDPDVIADLIAHERAQIPRRLAESRRQYEACLEEFGLTIPQERDKVLKRSD